MSAPTYDCSCWSARGFFLKARPNGVQRFLFHMSHSPGPMGGGKHGAVRHPGSAWRGMWLRSHTTAFGPSRQRESVVQANRLSHPSVGWDWQCGVGKGGGGGGLLVRLSKYAAWYVRVYPPV